MWRGCPFDELRAGSGPRRVGADRTTAYEDSGHHGDGNPHSWVARIKQKIPAPSEIDIAVVGVCPSSRPGLSDFEPVAAIREVRMACHHSHVADGKVVLASKVGAKMFIRDSP